MITLPNNGDDKMKIYFVDGDMVEFDEDTNDPMSEDHCVKCGEFSNWAESMLCNHCTPLFDYETN